MSIGFAKQPFALVGKGPQPFACKGKEGHCGHSISLEMQPWGTGEAICRECGAFHLYDPRGFGRDASGKYETIICRCGATALRRLDIPAGAVICPGCGARHCWRT